MEFIEQEYLDILKQYDSPTVSNAIELFAVQPQTKGFLPHTVRALFPQLPSLVGYACTATHRGLNPETRVEDARWFQEHLHTFERVPAPRVVVVQELDSTPSGATLGDGMTLAYRAFGAAGFVTDGLARDLQGIEPLDFAVFARGVVPSHTYFRLGDFAEPVEIGGMIIHHGDLIHGDRNGVVVIPNGIGREVALACPKIREAEAIVHDYLRQEGAILEGYAAKTAEYGKRQAAIANEVRRELVDREESR